MKVNNGSYQFDCIVSIASFHHMPIKESLLKMRSLLKNTGRIIILDLYKKNTFGDYAIEFPAFLLNTIFSLKNKNIKMHQEFHNAWNEHDQFDEYPTLKDILNISKEIFNYVGLKRLLFWRYILILEK